MWRPLFCTLLFSLFGQLTIAQKAVDQKIDLSFENKSLIQVLYQLSNRYKIDFYFDPKDLPSYPLSGEFEQVQLFQALRKLNDGTRMVVFQYEDKGLFVVDRTKTEKEYLESIYQKWQEGTFTYPFNLKEKVKSITIGDANEPKLKNQFLIKVTDQDSKDAIIGAILSNEDLSINDVSDVSGEINLVLDPGEYTFKISFTGYQPVQLNLSIYDSGELALPMNFQSFLFEEIEVVGNSIKSKVEEAALGKEIISIKKLERIPQALGEVDIIKALETLPGVTTAGELSVGFNIRGGNIDESLVLLNDGIIFNPTHIVGFISAFSADVVDIATLYKAYVDPAFGGRGSGILNLTSTASNAKEWKFKGGLGTSMIKGVVEGPISPKLRFHFGVRGSFNDYLLKLVNNIEIQNSRANFSDLNVGLSYDLSNNQELLLNGYRSTDLFEYNNEFGFKWQNEHLGLKWKSKWSEKLFSNLSLNYGSYFSENFTLNTAEAASFDSGIKYIKGLFDIKYDLGNNNGLNVGLEFIEYQNEREELRPAENSTLTQASILRPAGGSLSAYTSWRQHLGSRINIDLGARIVQYSTHGDGNVFTYSSEELIEENIESFEPLNGRDKEANYLLVEPRVSLNYKLAKNTSLKLAYNRMSQNLLQLTNNNTVLPTANWVFTNRYIKPLIVDQGSFGLFQLFEKSKSSISFDLFYKNFKQNYIVNDFSQIFLNEHIETDLVEAEGRSYGVELLVEKQKGRWQGSLAYTYSRSLKQTVDDFKLINLGQEFSADFDIPHQLNLIASYQWLPVVSVNFSYVYKSGSPTTLPSGTIIQDGIVIPLYSFRNQGRIPHYSRLDLSFTLDLREAKQKGVRNSFSIGFYNLLARKNPSNVFFRRSAKGNIVPFQFSVVGATIPTISWNFVY